MNPHDPEENPLPARNDVPGALRYVQAFLDAGEAPPPDRMKILLKLQDDDRLDALLDALEKVLPQSEG